VIRSLLKPKDALEITLLKADLCANKGKIGDIYEEKASFPLCSFDGELGFTSFGSQPEYFP
jgi:hypothetical protein